ncbi:MAG: DUF115 domain-containing protein [Candidatus Altiarchaeota archaeon]|nr:DUF115 domain-containing protein [Candidatus Altiarchaeota archaeon]
MDGWMTRYKAICGQLGIDPKGDEEAARLADALVGGRHMALEELRSVIEGRDAVVFGAGPSLESGSVGLKKDGRVFICSDGTISLLLKMGFIPEVDVTDLDGNIKDILRANELGTIAVVHAHGDNMDKLKRYLPLFKGKIVLTTQAEPIGKVRNFYGFTDGDRAVALAAYFGAGAIKLIGFDFGDIVGKYSNPAKPFKHKADDKKKMKLAIAKQLVGEFLKKY